jgi:uroporphyrinogen-III synthase
LVLSPFDGALSGIVSSNRTLDQMLNELVALTGEVTRSDACLVYLLDADSDEIVLRASQIPHAFEAFLSVPLVAGGEAIGVINAHHREPHEYEPEEIALVSFIGEQMGAAIVRARLGEENARLQEETLEMKRQLETRKLVERAKGILQQRLHLTEEDAYLQLRNESRRRRRPMRELAEAIIGGEEPGDS